MANLYNLDNKFLVTTGGNVLIGQTGAIGSPILQVDGGATFMGSVSVGVTGAVTDRRFQVTSGTYSSLTATTNQYGVVINPTYASNITNSIFNLYNGPALASGTTLTNLYNLYLEANGVSGSTVTNSYGVYQSGGGDKNYFAGNVGIGTDSPNTKLEVRGGSGSGEIAHATFTATANRGLKISTTSLPFGQNSGTVIFNAQDTEGYSQQWFQIGGATKMVIDNSGNVGIGTDSPSRELDIQASSGWAEIALRGNTGSGGSLEFWTNTTKRAEIFADTEDIVFRNTSTNQERMRIKSTGAIEIKGSSTTASAQAFITNDNSLLTIGSSVSGSVVKDIQFSSPSAMMYIDGSSGNVGIGTTSPGRGLTIDKSNANAALEIIKNNTTNQIVYLGTGSSGGTDDPLLRMYHNGTENIRLYTTGNSWINGGNVGIGTNSPSFPLDVSGIIRSSTSNVGYLYLGNTVQGTIAAGAIIAQRSPSYSSTGKLLFQVPTWGANTDYGLTTQMSIEVTGADTKAATMVLLEHGGNVGIGTASPATKLHVKDSQDSSLYSGLKVERSANTTAAYLNAVGGALNLNTDSSMPLKFRILNTSMQTINTNGGRAYAGFGGWRMFEYSYTVSVGNGATVDLFQNTSAHSDLHMVQIAVRMYHSGRTYFVGSGTVGGYGMNITGSGSGATNGGLTSAVVSSGIRKLQISQSSGYTAQATIYIQFRLDSGSGINVLNGTLSSL